MDWIADPSTWIALLTLTVLEIVLGIDNIVFISILADKLPHHEQPRARQIGLLLAMFSRIALLLSVAWLTRLTTPFFDLLGHEFSGRSLILIAGGLFLLAKSTYEIHDKLEGEVGQRAQATRVTVSGVVIQIMLLDIVFSIDSVLTAVGMAEQLLVMVAAIVVAVLIMLAASTPIAEFVNERPTIKILALSFLLLIGVSLVAEGLDFHIPKGYIYFAMAFSVFVELLNMRLRARPEQPVRLRQSYVEEASSAPAAEG